MLLQFWFGSKTAAAAAQSSTSCTPEQSDLGRVQIAVDQLPGGTYYPLISPSDNLDLLIGDLFLNYLDDNCQLGTPFKIAWLSGFGCEAAVNPTGEVHTYDLLIEDAGGGVVFDSRDATTYTEVDWTDSNENPFLKIIEWTNSTNEVLRVVVYTAWEETADAQNWLKYFAPANANLDVRTIQRIPRSVRSLAVITSDDQTNDIIISGGSNVILKATYNLELRSTALDVVDGGAVRNEISFDAEPGLGSGRFQDCATDALLHTINGIRPDARGNFTIGSDECRKLTVPVTSIVVGDAYDTATQTAAALKLHNDCSVCCDCEDFFAVYEAIRKLDARYRSLAARAEAIRDIYKRNKARWEAQQACRSGQIIRIATLPATNCRLGVAVAFCNNTNLNASDQKLKIDFTGSSRTGCVLCGSTLRRGNRDPNNNTNPQHYERYELSGNWPIYSAYFDCVSPGSLGYVTFMMSFKDCQSTDVVNIKASIHDVSTDTIVGEAVQTSAPTLVSEDQQDCCSLSV